MMGRGVQQGRRDGKAIAGYTGKELPVSAQHVKSAPQTLT